MYITIKVFKSIILFLTFIYKAYYKFIFFLFISLKCNKIQIETILKFQKINK